MDDNVDSQHATEGQSDDDVTGFSPATGSAADVDRIADSDEWAVHTAYDWGTTQPTVAVVESVAAATDREPTALPALTGVVDTDAVDGLFSADVGENVSLTFTYAGTAVRVRADGTIELAEID